MIYDFQAGHRKVDLAFAACRDDDTLCLFEITDNGTLQSTAGGSQPTTKDGFSVYGSCTYRSPKSGRQYLFVNSRTGDYLQFELAASSNGTLQATLVREFVGGEGGQTEGCVTDEENGYIFLGKSPVLFGGSTPSPMAVTRASLLLELAMVSSLRMSRACLSFTETKQTKASSLFPVRASVLTTSIDAHHRTSTF